MAQVNQRAQKKGALDDIVTGLDIAAKGYGLYSNYQTLQRAGETLDIAKRKEEREVEDSERKKSGLLLPTEAAALRKQGFTFGPTDKTDIGSTVGVMDDQGRATRFGLTMAPDAEKGQDLAKLKQQSRDTTLKIRDDYNAESKPTIEAVRAFKRLDASASNPNPTAATDIATVFSYMKTLDPGSTVREGEFATAQNAAGVPQQIRNMWNKVLTGERLSPQQRQDMLAEGQRIVRSTLDIQANIDSKYQKILTDFELDPSHVLDPQFNELNKNLEKQLNSPSIARALRAQNNPNSVSSMLKDVGNAIVPEATATTVRKPFDPNEFLKGQ